jgi:hypothetical protein
MPNQEDLVKRVYMKSSMQNLLRNSPNKHNISTTLIGKNMAVPYEINNSIFSRPPVGRNPRITNANARHRISKQFMAQSEAKAKQSQRILRAYQNE